MSTDLMNWITSRLKEPSTWASIGLMIVGIPGVRNYLDPLLPYLVPLLGGLGVVVPEKTS